MPSVTLSRLGFDTVGTADRIASISSALRGLLTLCNFRILSEPVLSRVKSDSEGFSAMIPLQRRLVVHNELREVAPTL